MFSWKYKTQLYYEGSPEINAGKHLEGIRLSHYKTEKIKFVGFTILEIPTQKICGADYETYVVKINKTCGSAQW